MTSGKRESLVLLIAELLFASNHEIYKALNKWVIADKMMELRFDTISHASFSTKKKVFEVLHNQEDTSNHDEYDNCFP